MQLTRVKSYRRAWSIPRCYVSRLPEESAWAEKLIHDLRDAGIHVVEEAAQAQPEDFILLLDTPNYQKAYHLSALADIALIRSRLGKRQLISLALTGRSETHELKDCKPGSFCDETHYPVSLFDLVLNLYVIPFTHVGFAPLRQALHEQWEKTLGLFQMVEKEVEPIIKSPTPKIFISYAHKDEKYKNEVVTMLAPLQRQGIIDIWHDRQIEEGDEWFKSISDAIEECDIALLLISMYFLNSQFIHNAELPRLLQRRKEEGLRIVPIIISPCLWQSEPILKDLQALPKDGKPVVSFRGPGERDRIWAEIAAAIKKRAKAMS